MNDLISVESIQSRIFTMRGVQVMLDRDLAILYGVETRALKQAVKRNLARFPLDFMFELTEDEISLMVSQSVIPSRKHLGGANPLVFTEQGVSSLSSVLTSTQAIKINIEKRQIAGEIKIDERFEQLFKALEDKSIKPKQGIFFDGQVFDAWRFISDLVRSATRSIMLIDNYIDDTVLTLFAKRKKGVTVTLLVKKISSQLELDVQKFNSQHEKVLLKQFSNSHDRFLIIDEKNLYHIGASLKDLGKKWFAFSKMEASSIAFLEKLKKEKVL